MAIVQVSAPNLSSVASGGATLYLLEAMGFSKDGKSLLVRATYVDDADAVPKLHYAVWVYDIQSKAYTVCLNALIAGSVAAGKSIDVLSAVVVGTETDPIYLAQSQAKASGSTSQLAWIRGTVIDANLLASTVGEDLGVRVDRYSLSADGRFLAIQTDSSALAPDKFPDTNDSSDVYLVDLLTKKVERVSFVAGAEVMAPVILGNVITVDDTVQVTFATTAAFKSSDTNSSLSDPTDLYVWSRTFDVSGLKGQATFTLISQNTTGKAAGFVSTDSPLLVTERGIIFNSAATDLIASDTNAASDVFFRATDGTLSRVAVPGTAQLNSGATLVSASRDGRVLVFLTASSEVAGSTGAQQLVAVDRVSGKWLVLSKNGAAFADDSVINGVLSPNGRWAAFTSAATNLDGTPAAISGGLFVMETGLGGNLAPTGSISITGLVQQGQTLSVSSSLVDQDGLGAFSYQWLCDGVEIAGANQATLTLTQAQVRKTISVRVSYVDGYGTAENVTSEATIKVANVNDLPTGSVTISGTAKQGETLTLTQSLADVDGLGTIAYQWYADGVAINGATSTRLLLTQAQVGKAVTVKASYIDGFGTAEVVASAATLKVVNVNDAPTGAIVISGLAKQGETLSALSTLKDADGLGTLVYQWQADGVAVAGATSSTLVLTQALVGKVISVAVSYTDALGTQESVVSGATDKVLNTNDAPTGAVIIAGTAREGDTLSVSNNLADLDGMGTVTYAWFADGVAIRGGTGATLKLNQALVGKVITVKASYTDGFGALEAVVSAGTAKVANVNDLPTGVVTIVGTASLGMMLKASNSLADADGLGTITYQWKADGQVIFGATDTVLYLTEDQVGKKITVVATYTDGQGTSESVSSAATNYVTASNSPAQGTVSVLGGATQGQTLSAGNSIYDEDGVGVLSFQWFADGQPIAGAQGTTLVLGQALVGKAISVAARYIDGQGTEETLTSTSTGKVTNINDAPTGALAVLGTVKQGELLSLADTLDDPDGLGAVSYQWYADSVAISGASASTLLLTQDQVGKAITVKASFTDGFGTAEVVTSAVTAKVLNVNDLPTGSVRISGAATQHQLLTASNTLADLDGIGAISYQWLADGVAIKGATSSTFTLTQAQVGKAVSVRASYTDGQGTAESVTSTQTDKVLNVNDAPVGSVVLTGYATEGQTLVSTQDISDEDGVGDLNYAWQVSSDAGKTWTALAGSTGSVNTLATSLIGKYVRLVVSYQDGYGAAESVASSSSHLIGIYLVGDSGADLLNGTAGDDLLDGASGGDSLVGGAGDDVYIVDTQADLVFESAGGGNDTVISSVSFYLYYANDNLTLTGDAYFGVGNEENNVITGNASQNLLIGWDGNDTIHGGDARDALFGVNGDDVLYGDAGIDYIVAGLGNDTIYGGNDADEIYGQEGNDLIYGGDDFSTDILVGGDGNDTLDGGAAWDLMYGGAGDDVYYVSQQVDWVFEQPGEGHDTVYSMSPNGYYLFANVEDLILLGDTPFGVGNELDNKLTGSASNNWLLGGAGNDTLNGGAGTDVLFGEAGADTFVIQRGTGLDIIADFATGVDKLDLSAYGFKSLADLKAKMFQIGGDISVDLGNGDSLILLGVNLNNIGNSDVLLGP